MKIMPRDIEMMRWIQEQKFMTGNQIRRVFWKGISANSREDYKRLCELQKADCLKRNKKDIYRNALYLVRSYGIKQLKEFGHKHGWNELYDVDYSLFNHDIAVTDLRILFNEWGYRDWISERVLSRWRSYRNLADGMIHHRENYFAIEYESSQKAKDRYKEIFLNYALDHQVNAVIYIMESPEMVTRVSREAASYKKVFFTTFQELQNQKLETQLHGNNGPSSLKSLLEGPIESRDLEPSREQLVHI